MKRRQILLALDWYHPKIHEGVAQFAAKHNWHLNSKTAFHHELPLHWQGDGIIASVEANTEYLEFVKRSNVPTVTIGHNKLSFPYLIFDDKLVGQKAAEFFIEHGYRNYAFCYVTQHRRGISFGQTLKEYGYQCQFILPENNPSDWEATNRWLGEQIKEAPKPLAVFCPDDNSASELVEVCVDIGIKVPEEVAVLGVHNDELICENSIVSLSSIDIDLIGMGYQAAEMLQKLMEYEEIEQNKTLIKPKQIVSRLSTDVMAYENIEVGTAMRFIKNNFSKYINVDDVVAVTNISRRSLYNAFEKHVGRSIANEITRCRMVQAELLLSETSTKISEIAHAVGFRYQCVFNQSFSKIHGMSPSQWRKENRPF